MDRTELLLLLAESYWDDYEPLPTDLYYQLAELGIDVPAVETKYLNKLSKSKE